VTDAALPPDERLPSPVVDLSVDGVFHLPPSKDTRRETIAITTFIAALLLHLLVLALLLSEWRTTSQPSVRPIQVQLRQELPKPPPAVKKPEPPKPKVEQPKPKPPEPAKPKPKPKPEEKKPPPPPPKPPEMKPRESGADQKTEAAKSEKPKEELPKAMPIQPKAEEIKPPPEPMPEVPEPKPIPPRAKQSAAGRGQIVPLEALPPALQPERPRQPAIRNLVLRLPGPGGGTGDRDYVGDAYLNRLRDMLERNRLYPPADAFGGTEKPVAVFAVQIEPSGQIVTITLLATTGVPKIDETAREMIDDSSPFPHLPSDYPQIRTVITVFLPMFPAR
jgi:outer membrane biosynthesis protein TonB